MLVMGSPSPVDVEKSSLETEMSPAVVTETVRKAIERLADVAMSMATLLVFILLRVHSRFIGEGPCS